ncbi:hypothetical protein BACCIP111883_03057 [Sutcliffiella rhizosphaerae]|uniref:Transposase n=2 Tax=Sutcliffiella rhizosphaerae TaxID=2880967 RepID=A0ABM8YQY9_9BACI|nr:hypothetical protein BACCIP111883_03057 [Sutcliffiella rhizosphaerae]
MITRELTEKQMLDIIELLKKHEKLVKATIEKYFLGCIELAYYLPKRRG